MDDLISRKALLAAYDRVHIGEPGMARKLMEDAPTVDAVEVVHGWWINKTKVIYGQDDVCYQCSHCETAYYYDAPERYNYCPNCGAKMDGDGNG